MVRHQASPSGAVSELALLLSEPMLIMAIERICRNSPTWATEGVLLLGHIDKFLLEFVSLEKVHCESDIELDETNCQMSNELLKQVAQIRDSIQVTRRSVAG